jgi:hypothetical protein
MKTILIIISILVISCENSENRNLKNTKQNKTQAKDNKPVLENSEKDKKNENEQKEKLFSFKTLKEKAILIGDNIELLELSGNKFKRKKNLDENLVVDIESISNILFGQTGYYCDSHHMFKIKTGDINGYIIGKYIYRIVNLKEEVSFIYDKKHFKIKKAKFFGRGEVNEEDKMDCDIKIEPILMYNIESNRVKLINLKINKLSNELSANDKYFELRSSYGYFDKIKSIETIEKGIILTISRDFEGYLDEYKVLITNEKGNFFGEYIKNGIDHKEAEVND